MVEVYLGVDELPLGDEAKQRLRILCSGMIMVARAREHLLVTHVFGPDPNAHSTNFKVRMALVLDGEDARYSEGIHLELGEAFRSATRSLEMQLQQELMFMHWHDHEDAVTAE